MALVWQCDRCSTVEDGGNVDDPPDDWVWLNVPIRGSEGARSSRRAVICPECDDALYEWWMTDPSAS